MLQAVATKIEPTRDLSRRLVATPAIESSLNDCLKKMLVNATAMTREAYYEKKVSSAIDLVQQVADAMTANQDQFHDLKQAFAGLTDDLALIRRRTATDHEELLKATQIIEEANGRVADAEARADAATTQAIALEDHVAQVEMQLDRMIEAVFSAFYQSDLRAAA